jgi:hypothetical protein
MIILGPGANPTTSEFTYNYNASVIVDYNIRYVGVLTHDRRIGSRPQIDRIFAPWAIYLEKKMKNLIPLVYLGQRKCVLMVRLLKWLLPRSNFFQ